MSISLYIYVYLDIFIHSVSDDSCANNRILSYNDIYMLIGTRLGTCYFDPPIYLIYLNLGKSDGVKYEKR